MVPAYGVESQSLTSAVLRGFLGSVSEEENGGYSTPHNHAATVQPLSMSRGSPRTTFVALESIGITGITANPYFFLLSLSLSSSLHTQPEFNKLRTTMIPVIPVIPVIPIRLLCPSV